MHRYGFFLYIGLFLIPLGCRSDTPTVVSEVSEVKAATPVHKAESVAVAPKSEEPEEQPEPEVRQPETPQAKVVEAARAQIGDAYVADYVAISYPNGDVPAGQGACTDVVVRSFRAVGLDLQRLVHEDMKRNFRLYPKRWGLRRPDPNIDHRRVPNLVTFFRRYGETLPTVATAKTASLWKPGDIVVWELPNGRDHCGIVTERIGASGLPTVVHNLGPCTEEDCLTAWRITGHYRYPKKGGA
ncbi:MAG: hypothetical protein OHK0029_37730 [Armatimonadaceae bacterium]